MGVLHRAEEAAVQFGGDQAMVGIGLDRIERRQIARVAGVCLTVWRDGLLGKHREDGGQVRPRRIAQDEVAHSAASTPATSSPTCTSPPGDALISATIPSQGTATSCPIFIPPCAPHPLPLPPPHPPPPPPPI